MPEQNEPTTGEIVQALIESYDERELGTSTEAYKSIVIRTLTEQQKQIAALTDRAESAERERDALKEKVTDYELASRGF